MNELLKAALDYAKLGWKVIPLHGVSENGHCLCREGCTGKITGKKPHIKEWGEKATTDETTIRAWWSKWKDANVGIVTGGPLLVVDVDPRNGGNETLTAIEKEHGQLATAQILTGGGGAHYYFLKDKDKKIKGGTGLLGLGIDIKSEGGFVVAPPSRHSSGEIYKWVTEHPHLRALPAWLLEEINKKHTKTPEVLPDRIPAGERHDVLLSYAGRLRQAGLTYEEISQKLNEANTRCVPPCSLSEIDEIAQSIMNYRVADYTFDGIGNAHRFRDEHKHVIRRCVDEGSWYIWRGNRWCRAADDEVTQLSIATIERIRTFASLSGDLEEKLRAWARACRTERRVRELCYLSTATEEFHIHSSSFDNDPFLLNCSNGTLQLKTLRLREHRREDLLTKKTRVRFNPDAHSERWDKFLYEVCRGKQDQINYLQLAVGYSLTGVTDEEKVFFIVGPGGTGKTTFVEAIRCVMDEYCTTSSPQEFLSATRSSSAPTPGIAKLAGTRLVISSEIPHGARLAEWVVKALTGGEVITARHLYREEFDFLPQFKLWMTMNEAPRFNYKDSGIKRRIVVIPFEFVPPQPDPTLKRAFRLDFSEQEAILAWAAHGALRWCEGDGLSEPDCIIEATQSYQAEQNPLSLWLDDETSRDEDAWTPTKKLRESFNLWASRKGVRLSDFGLVSDRAFADALRTLNFRKGNSVDKESGRMANGWSGIRLKTEQERF